MKRSVAGLSLIVFFSAFVLGLAPLAYAQADETKVPVAQGALRHVNPYYSTQTTTFSDGTSIERQIIKGPPAPPAGYERERPAVSAAASALAGTATLTVPAYQWVFGCSAVSAAMIAGYYDRNGFPLIYTGPTGDGLMPLTEDASWGTWSDGYSTYPANPLVASRNGLDGRVTLGSIDDYWIQYGSGEADPYVTGAWTPHAWGDSIGDYMKTGQSAYYNPDSWTTFYTYTTGPGRLNCTDMPKYSDQGWTVADLDGTYGRKLFYEARG
jgi:hypothetical protein